VRRGGLWAKHMGLKQGAIWNTLGEHIGNLKGTCWEQRKNEKNTNEGICMIIYLLNYFLGGGSYGGCTPIPTIPLTPY